MNLLCWLIGHREVNVDTDKFTADCARCGAKLSVTYDMLYGETRVMGVIK